MAKLGNLREVQVEDILPELPDVERLDLAHDTAGRKDELFLAALGFEDRCPWIPDLLADSGTYSAAHGVFFEYATNESDNDLNRPKLVPAMESFCSRVRAMPCDSDDYPSQLRTLLRELVATSDSPGVTFDISACSSKLLVTTLTILLESRVNLRIVYSEANLYHPTEREYKQDPLKWTTDEGMGLARGVSSVMPSPDHPGCRRDMLPEAVIVFPTFKPERSRAIIAHVDQSFLVRPKDRVIWLIGDPHLPEDHWRADALRAINEIPPSAPVHEVSTFDYKKTLETLERVHRPLDCMYHVNVAPLGSKLQSVGIVLLWYVRPEVSIIFASAREHNAAQYSEGCKATWRIDFGPTVDLLALLGTVGELQLTQ